MPQTLDRTGDIAAAAGGGYLRAVVALAPRLAQVNVARPRADLSSAVMAEFLAALEPINRLADASPGFVWRLRSAEAHGATFLPEGDRSWFVNLSVWTSYRQLHQFVYRSGHGAYLRRRSRWFLPSPQPTTALWWINGETRPTVEQALARLRHLQRYGPSPQAFSVRRR